MSPRPSRRSTVASTLPFLFATLLFAPGCGTGQEDGDVLRTKTPEEYDAIAEQEQELNSSPAPGPPAGVRP